MNHPKMCLARIRFLFCFKSTLTYNMTQFLFNEKQWQEKHENPCYKQKKIKETRRMYGNGVLFSQWCGMFSHFLMRQFPHALFSPNIIIFNLKNQNKIKLKRANYSDEKNIINNLGNSYGHFLVKTAGCWVTFSI